MLGGVAAKGRRKNSLIRGMISFSMWSDGMYLQHIRNENNAAFWTSSSLSSRYL